MHAYLMKTTAFALCALVAGGTLGIGAHAQAPSLEGSLRIATGPATGVYTQLARDMQKVCGHVVSLTPVPSKGGLDNLILLAASEADIGLAQIDLFQKMGKDGDQNIRELQAVLSMHSNLLHIVTKREGSKVGAVKWNPMSGTHKIFRKFSELKGVNVAVVGSAQVLGATLERQLGYGMNLLLAESDESAVEMLRTNQVEAIFTMGGWPYPAITKLKPEIGLMLAEFDLPPPAPFTLTKRNYPNMQAYNQEFLSSRNLLLARPFKGTGERGKLVSALQSCILKHMDEFQEGPYQAAWKEIRDPTETLGVPTIARASGSKVRP